MHSGHPDVSPHAVPHLARATLHRHVPLGRSVTLCAGLDTGCPALTVFQFLMDDLHKNDIFLGMSRPWTKNLLSSS